MKTYIYGSEVMDTSPIIGEEDNYMPIYYEIGNPSRKVTGLILAINNPPNPDLNYDKDQNLVKTYHQNDEKTLLLLAN